MYATLVSHLQALRVVVLIDTPPEARDVTDKYGVHNLKHLYACEDYGSLSHLSEVIDRSP